MTMRVYDREGLSQLLGLPAASTRVWISRKTAQGTWLRLRRNLYVRRDEFLNADEQDLFTLASLIQTPSYVSLLSALSFHELTTQRPASVIESMSPVRAISYSVEDITFAYHFARAGTFIQFHRIDSFFMASPEKALIDALYLQSLGRYALDTSALDWSNVNWSTVDRVAQLYPQRFQSFLKNFRKDL